MSSRPGLGFIRVSQALFAVVVLLTGAVGTTSAAEDPRETLVVDSSSTAHVSTSQNVVGGGHYRLEVQGTFIYGTVWTSSGSASLESDAECAEGGPNTFASLHPGEDWLDLYVNGRPADWKPLTSPGFCDSASSYYLDYAPQITGPISFRVQDDAYHDNRGHLTVEVHVISEPEAAPPPDPCATEMYQWPTGVEFQSRSAVNDSANETTDGCRNRQIEQFSYDCPEYSDVASDGTPNTYGDLKSAEVTLDSRANVFEFEPYGPSREANNRPKYDQSGHWGMYTCNWLKKNVEYRVTVAGKWMFDQTTQGGHGWADAECTTGYEPAAREDLDVPIEAYIPSYYQYLIDEINEKPRKELGADSVDKYVPTSTNFNQLGTTWLSDRFEFKVLEDATKTPPVYRTADPFDLTLNGNYPKWEPLGRVIGSCSLDNQYQTVIKGNGHPLRLSISELARYNDWDNCGLLKVHIDFATSTVAVPNKPDPAKCGWTAHPWARVVEIKDLKVSTFGEQTDHPYYFDPKNLLVRHRQDIPGSNESAPVTVQWNNVGVGPHTITAAVTTDGEICRPKTDVMQVDAQGNPDTDSCDGNGKERLFEECDAACLRTTGGYSWKLDSAAMNKVRNANVCQGGYCVIPYYCRVAPKEMAANIIIKDI